MFISYAWFYNGIGMNHASRLDMIFSAVHRGTLDITPFTRRDSPLFNTIDWARSPETPQVCYSNKAPGVALLGIPVYWLLVHIEDMAGVDITSVKWINLNAYFINLVVTVLPMALATGVFFWTLCSRLSPVLAFGAAWSLAFCTLTFPFSTQLWGHTTAEALIIVGLCLAYRPSPPRLLGAGCCLGFAVLCEYSSIFVIFAWLLLHCHRRKLRHLGAFTAGGIVPGAIYLVYHGTLFHSILPATFFNNPIFKAANQSIFHGGWTHLWTRLWGLTFSPYRGLFWYNPLFLLLLGMLFHWLVKGRRYRLTRMERVCLLSSGAFLAMNLAFHGWHGGWSSGPRYLIPALPCLIILIFFWFRRLRITTGHRRIAGFVGVGVLALLSLSNMLIISSVCTIAIDLETPMDSVLERRLWQNPLPYFYKSFFIDRLQPMTNRNFPVRLLPGKTGPRDERWRSFIMGRFLGCRGKWQVLILLPVIFAPWIVLLYHRRGEIESATQKEQ